MEKAFRKGLGLLRAKDVPKVRKEIRMSLGLSEQSRALFARYIDGKMTLDVTKYKEIGDIFKRYGVSDPWGAQ